jgi:hypothetical protein
LAGGGWGCLLTATDSFVAETAPVKHRSELCPQAVWGERELERAVLQ